MNARDFLAKADTLTPPPVVLFAPGKAPFNKEAWEPHLAEAGARALVKRFVDPSMEDLAYSVFHGDETAPGQVVQEAQTLPFLAERRVILVRNASRYADMSGEKSSPVLPLLQYLESPNETTLLILIADKVDKRKKFYTAIGKAGLVVECPQLEDRDLREWIVAAVKDTGKTIAANVADVLIERVGGRLSDIENAVRLVAGFVGDKPRIEEEDIRAATADVAEETVWDLTDAIAASDTNKALKTLHQLLELGKSHDEIIAIVNWLLESAYRAAPESAATLASKFVERKVMPLVKKFGFEKLKNALILCTDTNFQFRETGVDKDLALEMLVIKLAYRPARPGRRA